jgi:hypothetical protein
MAQFTSLNAAIDNHNGAVLTDMFQNEVLDLTSKAGELAKHITYRPATGQISRYIERISANPGVASDPRNIGPAGINVDRQERSVLVKAITNRVDFGLFDSLVYEGQGKLFGDLKAMDIKAMVEGILLTRDDKLWNGADVVSGAQTGDGSSLEYAGLLKQITNTLTIDVATDFVAAVRKKVAQMVQAAPAAKPTAIYVSPVLLSIIEEETRNSVGAMRFIQSDIKQGVAGLGINGIVTAAGVLPIYPDVFLPQATNGSDATKTDYTFAIISEPNVEFHYVGQPNVMVYELVQKDNLNSGYTGVLFGAPVAKGAGVAHAVGTVTR